LLGVFEDGGEMVVATSSDGGDVLGLAVFRSYRNTFNNGRILYVDDLIIDETKRSTGVGKALISWLEAEALRRGPPPPSS